MTAKVEHKNRSGCPIACSLDLLGDHWTLLVIRNLMFLGLHEYKDMLATEEKISSSILSDRLKKLKQNGIISVIDHPDNKKRKLYYLTEQGKDLIHIMVSLVFWADKHLQAHLRIPDQKRAIIAHGPENLTKETLKHLEAWEIEHLN